MALGLDMGLWDDGRLYEFVKCRFRYQVLVIEVVEFQNVWILSNSNDRLCEQAFLML